MKTLIVILGKPGSGKTTVGEMLASRKSGTHISFSQVLKSIEMSPGENGYSLESRVEAKDHIIALSNDVDVLVLDANPYSDYSIGMFREIMTYFELSIIVHLVVDDVTAHQRLSERGRAVLSHDKNNSERIDNFNARVLPRILDIERSQKVYTFDTARMTPEQITVSISNLLEAQQIV